MDGFVRQDMHRECSFCGQFDRRRGIFLWRHGLLSLCLGGNRQCPVAGRQAINNLYLKFVKNADDTFTVMSWKYLEIADGECTYTGNGFDFRYDYIDGDARYRIKGTLTK
jgi:hypothetical protein